RFSPRGLTDLKWLAPRATSVPPAESASPSTSKTTTTTSSTVSSSPPPTLTSRQPFPCGKAQRESWENPSSLWSTPMSSGRIQTLPATTMARLVNDRNGGKDEGALDAGPCPVPSWIEAEALGNLTAILAARLNGSKMVGPTGDVNPTGRICLAIYEQDDYNVLYSVVVSTSNPSEPVALPMWEGAAGELGKPIVALVNPGVQWRKLTPPPPRRYLDQRSTPAPPPPIYSYAINGTWLEASTLPTDDGHTIKQLLDKIIAKLDGYYARLETNAYASGAARGQFKSEPIHVGTVGTNFTGPGTGDVNAIGFFFLSAFLVVIKKVNDVALTVVSSNATWTNRTLSEAERAKLGGKLTPKGKKGKKPPPPPPLYYNYVTSGTWLC
ncbi:unnamed protein product, partial [Closterium sp. Naga37s-1]